MRARAHTHAAVPGRSTRALGAMPSDLSVPSARDLTLQKIGRNVVNFQKMEAMLKFILKVANFAAPISKGTDHFAVRSKLYRTKPMGHLVDLAAKACMARLRQCPQTFARYG